LNSSSNVSTAVISTPPSAALAAMMANVANVRRFRGAATCHE
jgi:hypothetical protein